MSGAEAVNETANEPIVARTDAADRLVSADMPLAEVQAACGGEIPGVIAAPELLELVRKARGFGMRLGRPVAMRHSDGALEGWAEVEPDDEGCAIRLTNWHRSDQGLPRGNGEATRLAVENLLAEGVVWLDDGQRVLALESQAADLDGLVKRARSMRGQHWTRLFDFSDEVDATPPIWQVRSGMQVNVEGSARAWHLLLTPGQVGFQLLLRPIGGGEVSGEEDLLPRDLLGGQLAPAVKNPVRRIIRQAEAIRDRLAGPLPEEYREYAVDIVSAGKHLGELAAELGDAEAIEHGTIGISVEPVDLAEVADAACRLLQRRADARGVSLAVEGADLVALADRRRLMQICLNIVGNAVDYGPESGKVTVAVRRDGETALVRITDEGESLPAEDRARMFDKFERLGRTGDNGSGLGLYIARMLARAMGGDLHAEAGDDGRGNSFVISLQPA